MTKRGLAGGNMVGILERHHVYQSSSPTPHRKNFDHPSYPTFGPCPVHRDRFDRLDSALFSRRRRFARSPPSTPPSAYSTRDSSPKERKTNGRKRETRTDTLRGIYLSLTRLLGGFEDPGSLPCPPPRRGWTTGAPPNIASTPRGTKNANTLRNRRRLSCGSGNAPRQRTMRSCPWRRRPRMEKLKRHIGN